MSNSQNESDEDPLDVEMSARDGKAPAVAQLLEATREHVSRLPDDMRLNVQIDIWEVEDDR